MLLIIVGRTVSVTSDDFDIRLMIYLLKTITKVDVGDLYPLEVDISTSAMLSRIKFIRNETTQSIEGELSENQYNKFWDDIGQVKFHTTSHLLFQSAGGCSFRHVIFVICQRGHISTFLDL